jgi:hypothetical protein
MTESSVRLKVFVATSIFLSLLIVPAPLLPPDFWVEGFQRILGVGWEVAYLVAAVAIRAMFYASIGTLSSFLFNRSSSLAGQTLQFGLVSLVLVCGALFVRSAKAGHYPVLANVLVPVGSCVLGIALGFGLRRRQRYIIVLSACIGTGLGIWALRSHLNPELKAATEQHLRQIGDAGSTLPSGDARFLASMQVAFVAVPNDSSSTNLIQHNRAAILASGIALGHPSLARFVGIDPQSKLVRLAGAACEKTTLHGRSDWPQHYALSAALAILEHPFISDAGGLMKEELDAVTQGSGFSFGDLAADRAGVRLAMSATLSDEAAEITRTRILHGSTLDDFFPSTLEFPENLTLEEFRKRFGGVGSYRYGMEIRKIDGELDRCAALSAALF